MLKLKCTTNTARKDGLPVKILQSEMNTVNSPSFECHCCKTKLFSPFSRIFSKTNLVLLLSRLKTSKSCIRSFIPAQIWPSWNDTINVIGGAWCCWGVLSRLWRQVIYGSLGSRLLRSIRSNPAGPLDAWDMVTHSVYLTGQSNTCLSGLTPSEC